MVHSHIIAKGVLLICTHETDITCQKCIDFYTEQHRRISKMRERKRDEYHPDNKLYFCTGMQK